MELSTLSTNQFAIFLPVAVVVFALLIFAFGFKSSVEPPSFKHISFTPDEKKSLKKKKIKDKKSQTNGHATVVIDVPDVKKGEGSSKAGKQTSKVETPKQKKNTELEKSEKKTEQNKSPVKKEKKSSEGKKKDVVEKPADFDEGEWETAPSRKDKKKRKDDDIIAAITPEKVAKKKTPPPSKEKVEEIVKVEAKIEEISQKSGNVPAPEKAATDPEPVDSTPTASASPTSTPIPTAQPPAPAKQAEPEPTDDQIGKKKKGKKGKSNLPEDDAVVPEVEQSADSPPPAVAESPQAFNELEDSWKDAPQRKSKKKVRKD